CRARRSAAGAPTRRGRLREPDRDGALARRVAPAHLRRAPPRRRGCSPAGDNRRSAGGGGGEARGGGGQAGGGGLAKGAGGPQARRLGRLRSGAEAAGGDASTAQGTALTTYRDRWPGGIGCRSALMNPVVVVR